MRKLFALALAFSAFSAQPFFAQNVAPADSLLPTINYEKPQEFEIGGVKITGARYADAGALTSVAGLRVGQKIRIPGPDVTRAMKALWGLKLFTDVQFLKERTQGNLIFLEIAVKELPRYTRHAFKGVKKGQHEDLNGIINQRLLKGSIMTAALQAELNTAIEKHYKEKGFLDAKSTIKIIPDEKQINAVRLDFLVSRGKKVKIQDITFSGADNAKARKLRRKMKETKVKRRIFGGSKLVQAEYETDKTKVIDYYNSIGFRDAKIEKDSIWREKDGDVRIHLTIDEGRRYYFRNIAWKGNTIYESPFLSQVLGINRGDVYNAELLENRLKFSQDGRDISSLYLDNGYLFFNCDPVEVAIEGDSIDLEMRMYEGPQATIDRVSIKGNDRTHEHVVRRELFTRPGDKFSRSDIIRSQREIINLGYFNPEAMDIQTPVNPQRGTVDIEYTLEEKPSDQLELSAGYQPKSSVYQSGGVIGTLGVTFNNFSLRNIPKRSTWNPLPQGDGQRLSLRAQTAGERFQSYNVSFTEPWLGGKKPNSLTVAGVYNRFNNSLIISQPQRFEIIQGTVGFGTRLKWPDDNFVFRSNAEIQQLRLTNYDIFRTPEGVSLANGRFNNFNLEISLTRNSINDPLFPKSGSMFTLTGKFTPPYSLLGNKNYSSDDLKERYKWLEYHKWRFDAEWYVNLVEKLVLKTSAKIGALGSYNSEVGLSPFERYELGGDGIQNQQIGITGRDIISSRGYAAADIRGNGAGGAAVFNKYTVELRYPLSTNPSSTIFATVFGQAGNSWQKASLWNPFDLKRSAGVGLRVFLPMFGTLGFDYGVGFDKPGVYQNGSRKLKDYGTFNIILGFEPD